jgi:archaemetzincin
MKNAYRVGVVALALAGTAASCKGSREQAERLVPMAKGSDHKPEMPEQTYSELEIRLAPLASKLGQPSRGEWLNEHRESGQTFEEYRQARPVRRGRRCNKIYLCLVGEFTDSQRRVADLTCEYLQLFFDTPVKVLRQVQLEDIPARARRRHPEWGDAQILTTYVLDELLKPDRPDGALAYVALTASDLWPGENWNFVFGQASLRERTGVWSMYRNGDPANGRAEFQRCLKRTLGTASHETAHILTMWHCTVYECSMNGSNNQAESDRKPLHLCPTCLRKLCWNLRVEPIAYLARLELLCRALGIDEEADWYARALQVVDTRRAAGA